MDCPVTARPTVIVISDSLGDTACEVVLAASGQFDEGAFRVLRLPKVTSVGQVKSFVGPRVDADHRDVAVFHTIVDPALRARVLDYLGMLHIRSVDLIGPTLAVLSSLIGVPPKCVAGVIHKTDDRYFHRIEAMEYFVEHDDGRGCDDLSGADIVLLGVSRTSKTPLSMYLAYQGYKVANVPLAHGMEPPKSIYEVDPMHLFGLISTVDVISEIRDSRLGDDYARAVAGSYAEPESVRFRPSAWSCPHEALRLLCCAYRRQSHRGKRCRDHCSPRRDSRGKSPPCRPPRSTKVAHLGQGCLGS